MKNGENFNPERNYLGEALFKAFGGYFFWLIKGKRTSLTEEMQKVFRNVFTSIFFYALFLVLIYFIYKSIYY